MSTLEQFSQQTSVQITEPIPEQSSKLVDLLNVSLSTGSEFHINGLEMLALLFIALATLMALYRLVFGPTNPDRVVSADALTVIATAIICIMAALFQSILYLDVALIYGVLSFAGVLALARAIENAKENVKENVNKGDRS